MSKMIQIRNVPDALHRRLKSMAAQGGRSLSDFLLDELRKTAERPTLEELYSRILTREKVVLTESPADAIRAGREENDRARDASRRRTTR
jgi:plasmid stability protein